ncbi:hypothetical protein MAR_031414, partial [Mya arenaria]
MPLTAVMVVNVLLYILTFIKIRIEVIAAREILGKMTSTAYRHIRAARNMSMFVASLFALMVLHCCAEVPVILNLFIMVLANSGGVFNLIVYLAVFKEEKPLSRMAKRMDSRRTHS